MAFKDAKTEFERQYLIHLMEITEGNVSQAAKLAGKYRADLYELLKKHDLDPEGFRGSSWKGILHSSIASARLCSGNPSAQNLKI